MNSLIDWQSALDSVTIKDYKNLRNQRLILKRLEEVQEEVHAVGTKIDEQTIIKARTGLLHLVSGFNSDVEEVRALEFQMARGIFSGLVNLDPQGITKGTTTPIDNMILICVGYWGNFHYFNYYKDYKNALIQVYESALKCPDIALRFFPSELFSKNYLNIIETSKGELTSAIEELKRIDSDNLSKSLKYYFKAGLVGVGLLVAGTTFPTTIPYIAAGGKKALSEFVGSNECTPTENLKNKIEFCSLRLRGHYSELSSECEKCLDDLTKAVI